MATHTSLPNEKLNPWYFAVRWASMCLQDKIRRSKELGYSTQYDEYHVQHLEDMEQFFKMSWDMWLEELSASAPAECAEIKEASLQ